MTETPDAYNALSVITEGVSGLPSLIKTTFAAAASRLAGGITSVPAAWLRRYVQGVEDTTDARSLAARELALLAVSDAKTDPAVIEAVKQIYLPDVVRKTINRIRVAEKAAEELSSSSDGLEKLIDVQPPIEDDWFNTFTRVAEDASSEQLQTLLGKILAGEVKRQGSYSPATLRTVSEMTQELAQDFASTWDLSMGEEILRDPITKGETWARVARLRDAGLLSPIDSAIWQPDFMPILEGASPWAIGAEGGQLLIGMHQPVSAFINVIRFTTVGRELGGLLPKPNYKANLTKVAEQLPKHGVAWIVFVSPEEATYEATFTASGWEGKAPSVQFAPD